MANVITGLRILVSAALLFCPVFSPIFYAMYLIAGLSDMADGIVARKTNSVSEFGSRFDSIADFVFVAVCLIKILPVMDIPIWLYVWTAVMLDIFSTNETPITALQNEEDLIVLQPKEIYMVRVEAGYTIIYGEKQKYRSRKRLYEIGQQLGKQVKILLSEYSVSVNPALGFPDMNGHVSARDIVIVEMDNF